MVPLTAAWRRAAAGAATVALGGGCTPLLLVEGAIPLEPGATETRVMVGAAREPNAVSTPMGIVLPSLGFTKRFGLAPDTDLGVHAYTLGLGVDVRRRIVESGGWSVAVAPGFTGMFVPIPAFQYATLDFALPLRVERRLGSRVSVAGGPGVVLRQTFASFDTEQVQSIGTTAELLAGGGVRGEVRLGRVSLGAAGSAYVDITRGSGLYGGGALDIAWRPAPATADGYGGGR